MSANLENSAVAKGLEKVFSFQSQRKAVPRMFNYSIIVCNPCASKVML